MRDRWFLITVLVTFSYLVFNVWVLTLSSLRLDNGNIIDTTTIVQALSSALFSHLFFWTSVPGGPFFGIHATTFFFAILPFYSIFPNFIGEYAIEYLLVYAGAIPVYLIARKVFNSGLYSFLFSVSYLLYTSILGFPFSGEEIIMFMGPAIFAIYFLETDRKIPFTISLILILSTIEFSPFVGAFLFIYLVVRQNLAGRAKAFFLRKDSVRTFLGHLGNYYIVVTLVLSVFFYYFDSWMTLFFSHGTHSIFINLQGVNVFSVSSLLSGLRTDDFTKYLNLMYLDGPFLFLAFLDPIFIVQLPWFLATAFTTTTFYFSPGAYYDAIIAAFIPIGSLFGLRRISQKVEPSKRNDFHKRFVIITLILCVILFLATTVGVQYYAQYSRSPVTADDQGLLFLSQQLNQGPLVDEAYYDLPVTGIYDWNDTYYGAQTGKIIFDGGPPFSLSGYGFYAADGPFMMYEKNYSSQPIYNYFYYSSEQILNQQNSYSFFSPPGNYTISLSLDHYHYSEPLAMGNSSGSDYFVPLGSAIAIPFELKHPAVLQAVSVQTTNEGSAWLYGVISSSDTSVPIQSVSSANFNFQYFER